METPRVRFYFAYNSPYAYLANGTPAGFEYLANHRIRRALIRRPVPLHTIDACAREPPLCSRVCGEGGGGFGPNASLR